MTLTTGQSLMDFREAAGLDAEAFAMLQGLIEARDLTRRETEIVVRSVLGAIRPNRDRPLWDLCLLVVDLASALYGSADDLDEQCIAALLEPDGTMARDALQPLRAPDGRPRWSPLQVSTLLALADFLLTHEDLLRYAEVAGHIRTLAMARSDGREQAVRSVSGKLSQVMRAYRIAHLALAPHETVFRSIESFMRAAGRSGGTLASFSDDDIVGYWRHEMQDGLPMMYRSAVQRMITFRRILSELPERGALNAPVALVQQTSGAKPVAGTVDIAQIDGETSGLDVIEEDAQAVLERFIAAGNPQGIKVLKDTERDRLGLLVDCHDILARLPLTVLRYIVFGDVQSGISNYLRRGQGGAPVAERVKCADAQAYDDVVEAYDKLRVHVGRLLLIAGHLAQGSGACASEDPRFAELAERGERELKRMKRQGFDGDRKMLGAELLAVAEGLDGMSRRMNSFLEVARTLTGGKAPAEKFVADRRLFAEILERIYASSTAT